MNWLATGTFVYAAILIALAALLLPAMITGDWYHDRVERIMRGEQ